MTTETKEPTNDQFHSITDALVDFKAGKSVILVDDEDRENEGDLVLAAELVTPDAINFMAKFGRGLICLALTPERVEELKLPPQTQENTATFGTAFTVSIDAAKNITTGISAADRATTIKLAVDPQAKPTDFARPGHVFPLKAHKGGVLRRAGQTEGSVDLARLAGLNPAAVICEIMNDDGTMARVPHLLEFAKQHQLKIITVNRSHSISTASGNVCQRNGPCQSPDKTLANLRRWYLKMNWMLERMLLWSRAK